MIQTILMILCAVVFHLCFNKTARRVPNFKGMPVICSYGIPETVYMAAAAIILTKLPYDFINRDLLPVTGHQIFMGRAIVFVTGAMCVLGALDDFYGTREVGGFKGHFRMLIKEHKLTTGAVKALGGGLVGVIFAAVSFFSRMIPADMIIPAALIVPLSANTVNILDLRPGRAAAAFFAGIIVTLIFAAKLLLPMSAVYAVLAIIFIFAVFDSRAKMMMGDAGSNSIGAFAGVISALACPLWFNIIAILFHIAIQLYSEKHSITKLIAENKVLNKIDRLIGVRD